MSKQDFSVVYADAALLVLDKPSGLLTVPGRGPHKADCLSARVQRVYGDARVVHRLDMGTSGLVVMPRGETMLRLVGELFSGRKVSKRYQALVHGVPLQAKPGDWQVTRVPIRPDWPFRPNQIVDWRRGKACETRWRVVKTERGVSLVDLEPVTGRTHQLRVHMAWCGAPLLGDHMYGIPNDGAPRLMLHAGYLSFRHPVTQEVMEFQAPTPFGLSRG